MEAGATDEQDTDGLWYRYPHSRNHNFYIRIVNAEQRAGILGMRQGRIEAPSEVD